MLQSTRSKRVVHSLVTEQLVQWFPTILGAEEPCLQTGFEAQCISRQASQVALGIKNLPASAGGTRDTGLTSGSGRSPRGGHGNPLQYFCLENPMDRGAWWAKTVGCKEPDTTEAT